ncbi:restriction endonuclease subunit S [Nostoc sp. XA010]|uniref:restriction endonuclease subunit S n=1 Tax=Nostoc sp. XA010 TaxID=2780407 RepID=UPI001E58F4BC|nr:restriction endonuclease subunit S [Nostoc sp. XA010]MCC5661446.1 restriction endonuclease subunit S [Nostoc sp. XA010]
MNVPTVPLHKLLHNSFQGILLNRYQDHQGELYSIINVRNLEYIDVSGELSRVPIKVFNLQHQVICGDVIVSLRGTSLKGSVVPSKIQGSLAGQNLAVLRVNPELIEPGYLAVVMRSQWLQKKIAPLYMQSTGTQSLSLSQIRKLDIPLPSLVTQQQIIELFCATEKVTQIAQEMIVARQQLAESAFINVIEGKL